MQRKKIKTLSFERVEELREKYQLEKLKNKKSIAKAATQKTRGINRYKKIVEERRRLLMISGGRPESKRSRF